MKKWMCKIAGRRFVGPNPCFNAERNSGSNRLKRLLYLKALFLTGFMDYKNDPVMKNVTIFA